ncbi:MAG: hypothetical protein QM582_04275 [Micropruina sp.]|uniref:hypothetical protein n=1 Tax=Micropruina sp. TaxID=2737536 RepID=UPI0039E2738A
MDEWDQGFRSALRRVDELDPSVAPIDPEALVTRAGRARRSRAERAIVLLAAAVLAVVALASWTGFGRTAVPAVPEPMASTTPPDAGVGWVRIAAGPLSARWGAAGVWVDDRYLVVGGREGVPCPAGANCADRRKPLTDGALYDPATDSWQRIADAPSENGVGSQAVVVGTSVYLMEGRPSRSLLRYDLASDAWRTYRLLESFSGTLVATDRAVILLSDTDEFGTVPDRVFDPADASWSTLPDDPLGSSFDRTAVWLGDRLLLAAHDLVDNPGGKKPSLMRLAELDATLTRWRTLADSPILGNGAQQLVVAGRVVWPSIGSADGGKVGNWGRAYPYGGILDPATGAWTELPEAGRKTGGLGDYRAATARLVTVAGNLLDPAARTWVDVPRLPDGERTEATVVGGPQSVLVWGGSDGTVSRTEGYLFRV